MRVNQAGYPTGAPKRAYLLAPVAAPGAGFTVVRAGGGVALRGRLGADLGAWSARFPHVYAIDFSRLRRPGAYTIAVAGPAAAVSVPFRVASGAALAARPIRNALAFYQDERDGPNYIPSPLRTAPGHLNDAHAMTYLTPRVDGDGNFRGDLQPLATRIDAAGGWWDAGDYLKFVETTSYTDDVLLAALRDFPRPLHVRVHGHSFAAEAAFGVRWLLRMWDDRTRTLYYQVGIGEGNDRIVGDHDIWRLPQADDRYGGTSPATRYVRHRPVFRAGPPGAPVSPNLAGRDAAAFGLCYQVYRRTHPRLAARCLRSGEHIFALADTHPGRLLSVIPFDFYPETEWRDDMELGATELAIADAFALLPAPGRALGARLHRRPERRRRHPQSLRRERPRALRPGARAAGRAPPRGLAVTVGALLVDMRRQLARRRRRPAPTRSGSASPGRSGTPPRTVSGWRSRRGSTTS